MCQSVLTVTYTDNAHLVSPENWKLRYINTVVSHVGSYCSFSGCLCIPASCVLSAYSFKNKSDCAYVSEFDIIRNPVHPK